MWGRVVAPIKTLHHAVEDSRASRSAAELGQAWEQAEHTLIQITQSVLSSTMQPSADARFEVICISIKTKPSRRDSDWA